MVVDGLATLTPEWIDRRFSIVTHAYNPVKPMPVIRERDATVPCNRA